MSAPVKNTCPDIDKLIEYIKKAMKIAKDGRNEFPQADVEFYDIYSYLDGCEDMLEDLRKSNSALRNWGYDLEKVVKQHEVQLSDMEGQIENLKEQSSLCQERSTPTILS